MTDDKLAVLGGEPVVDRDAHVLWPIIADEDKEAVRRVLDRGILSGGSAPEARALEHEFAQYVDARYSLLTHSGTSALYLTVAANGLHGGDEVIVPAYSFIATAFSVLQAGGVPIFADIDPVTCNIDPAKAEAAIGPRTRAIMPVHVHGCPADMEAIEAVASRHGLVVLEDAAQAHGARSGGRPVGALGAAGGFSLQASKNLSAGEGGILVTNSEEVWERANQIRSFGQDLQRIDAETYDESRPLDGNRALMSHRLGGMYRGNEMMAAFARAQLRRLPALTTQAQSNAARLSSQLGELPGVLPPRVPEGCESVFHKYRVGLDAVAAGVKVQPSRVSRCGHRSTASRGR